MYLSWNNVHVKYQNLSLEHHRYITRRKIYILYLVYLRMLVNQKSNKHIIREHSNGILIETLHLKLRKSSQKSQMPMKHSEMKKKDKSMIPWDSQETNKIWVDLDKMEEILLAVSVDSGINNKEEDNNSLKSFSVILKTSSIWELRGWDNPRVKISSLIWKSISWSL